MTNVLQIQDGSDGYYHDEQANLSYNLPLNLINNTSGYFLRHLGTVNRLGYFNVFVIDTTLIRYRHIDLFSGPEGMNLIARLYIPG